MLKFSKFAMLSTLLAFTACTQAADEKAAALVNGVAIPQSRVDLRVKFAAQQGQPDTPELQKAIKDDLINLEVISQAAAKAGLDKQAETAEQIELSRQSILASAYVQDYAKTHPVSEEALKQEFDAMKSRIGNKEFKLSHILVASEEEANKVAADLKKKGASFAKTAKAKSMDPGSKDKGGELGWSVPANFVQPFAEAAAQLKKGQVSAPVQTQFGWHIIKLEDTRELKVPSFDEIKPNLEKRLQQQALQKAIEELRGKARIE
ncbi:MAG: peptidylprolyl isomerase [Gammaproteobacteria bacterium]|nr:peptidylprolyl isomerase [Gammaproteobacteria bacterium]MBU1775820.1 peptidylprolyl isomerase [Gammaproteobacteria bacterium]MBU1969177.1 peptidylprolyl isomerase [Gammaproteobacteria bacterium]